MVPIEQQDKLQATHLEKGEGGGGTYEDKHREGQWHAIKNNKRCVGWLLYTVFVLCIQGFDNQAGGIVLGIEEFRKDFGYAFNGNYVLPAGWQASSAPEILSFPTHC